MKRSMTIWTATLATTALLGLPATSLATQQPDAPPQQQPAPQPTQPQPPQPQPAQPQPPQPQPTQPQPAQPQPTDPQPTQPQQPSTPPSTSPQPSTSAPAAAPTTSADQTTSPEDHLRQASAALSEIKTNSIPAHDRAQFAELRRHLAALENPKATPSSSRSSASPGTASASTQSWGTEVAAIDRIITNLAGSDTATGTAGMTAGTATGTSGTNRGTRTGSSGSVDDATRAKLMEIRSHITAYAAAKAGTASTPSSSASSTMANETMTTAAQSSTGQSSTTTTQSSASQPSTAAQSTTAGQSPTAGQPSTTSPQTTATQGTPAQETPQAGAAASSSVDAEAAHRELLAARDSLSQLTQLPAAAQLSGDARTQVQQLITNFNELITNSTDWRASYDKVAGTLTSLLGSDTSDAAATATTPSPTAAGAANPGAVGTTGSATVQLDPAVRAKLVELRTHLSQFEKASGGGGK
jgi:hypothetical protein